MDVSKETAPADCEYTERANVLRMDLEDLLARLSELVDDMRHEDNVDRVQSTEGWEA